LNCTNAIHEISSYIDGELEASVRIELEEHLRECEGCAIVVRQTQLTVEIFCNDKPVELPSEVRSRLHETLKRRIHKSK
jgi:anti-sigma factor RsiW